MGPGRAALTRRWWAAALVVWLAIETLVFIRVVPTRAVLSPDGVDFVRVSHASIFSSGFWASTRAPVLPLLLRVVGTDVGTVAIAHAVIAALCWGALALAAATWMRTPVGRAATFVAVLVLSATFQVDVWHGVVLAESLSLSLTALLLAVVLMAAPKWSWPLVGVVAVVGALFVFVRDTNALLGVIAVGALVVGVVVGRVPRRSLVAAALLLAASLGAMASSSAGDRWLQGLHHTVRDRVLATASGTEWFESRGMPDADLVRGPDGDDYAPGNTFWHDPRFAAYRSWLRAHGRAALATYAAAHPSFLWRPPFASLSAIGGPTPSVRGYRAYTKTGAPLGSTMNAWVWPESGGGVVVITLIGVAIGVAVAIVGWREPRSRTSLVLALLALGCVACGYATALFAANLDTAETPRHVIEQIALARIGLVLSMAVGLDVAVDVISERGSSRSTDSVSDLVDPGTSIPPTSNRTGARPASSSAGS